MSYSQKFQGKVLVPWYSSFEWKYIFDVLCEKNNVEYPKILDILEMWKFRLPFLSAGIEGTLILLKALVLNKDNLTEDELIQIYSISLLRFLNLSATNNEKQGTFNQTALKNDLPKWLIDVRHDIAHHNKLPSKSVLKLAIYTCLEWIIKKYWKVQNKTICDYVVTESIQDSKITEILSLYCEMKTNLYYGRNMNIQNEALLKKINYFITKRHSSESTDFNGILNILEEMLTQSLEKVECKKSGEDMINMLTSEKGIFALISHMEIEGLESIPYTLKNTWSNLFNILINSGLLFNLVKKFHEMTNDLFVSVKVKKVSSLWAKDIFQELLTVKNKDELLDPTNSKSSVLNSFNSVLFEKIVLRSANTYTLDYLIYLLQLNNYSEEEVNSTLQLVHSMVYEKNYWKGEQFDSYFQIEELLDSNIVMDFEEVSIQKKDMEPSKNEPTRTKWRLVPNRADFEGCPLGILPHQDRSRNPCLVLNKYI